MDERVEGKMVKIFYHDKSDQYILRSKIVRIRRRMCYKVCMSETKEPFYWIRLRRRRKEIEEINKDNDMVGN